MPHCLFLVIFIDHLNSIRILLEFDERREKTNPCLEQQQQKKKRKRKQCTKPIIRFNGYRRNRTLHLFSTGFHFNRIMLLSRNWNFKLYDSIKSGIVHLDISFSFHQWDDMERRLSGFLFYDEFEY